MSEDPTARSSHEASTVPLQAIRLEVVEGPDTGATHVSRDVAVSVGTAEGNDLRLSDPTVSRYHLELRRRGSRIVVLDLASTNATAVGPAIVQDGRVMIETGTTLTLGDTKLRVDDDRVVLLELEQAPGFEGLVGESHAMRHVTSTAGKLAQSEVSVLLLGESGTGKEVVARALHEAGPRSDGPFVTLDCGAIPPQLAASELFGHEKGAFTGADRQHRGAFERADGGTLFLDEVGELPLEQQAALLGVLERREVQRVGGSRSVAVDVRVVAATLRDLRAAVNQERFRLDLYYRLAVVKLELPPLRERPEDIPALVEHFLIEEGRDPSARGELFGPAEMKRLERHPWPGNVRELKNVVLATIALGAPPELETAPDGAPTSDSFAGVLDQRYRDARASVLDEFNRRYLTRLLERANGNVRQAARDAQMDRSYLTTLLRRYGMR